MLCAEGTVTGRGGEVIGGKGLFRGVLIEEVYDTQDLIVFRGNILRGRRCVRKDRFRSEVY